MPAPGLRTRVSDPPVSLRDPTPNRLAALPRGSLRELVWTCAGADPGAGWRGVDTLDPAHGRGEMTWEDGRLTTAGGTELGLVVWQDGDDRVIRANAAAGPAQRAHTSATSSTCATCAAAWMILSRSSSSTPSNTRGQRRTRITWLSAVVSAGDVRVSVLRPRPCTQLGAVFQKTPYVRRCPFRTDLEEGPQGLKRSRPSNVYEGRQIGSYPRW